MDRFASSVYGRRLGRAAELSAAAGLDGLFVTPGASTSSPGLAFLLATIGAKGDDGTRRG